MPEILGTHIAIRTAEPKDAGFIVDSWVESYQIAHGAGPIPPDLFRPVYQEIATRVLGKSRALVAYNVRDPDQLFGHIVWSYHSDDDLPILHWIYVKGFLRSRGKKDSSERIGGGLGRALFEGAALDPRKPFLYGFRGRMATDLLRNWVGGRFDPQAVKKIAYLPGTITHLVTQAREAV